MKELEEHEEEGPSSCPKCRTVQILEPFNYLSIHPSIYPGWLFSALVQDWQHLRRHNIHRC
ncbi:MAG TPA: hypothetical protein VGO47_13195 [Chlamydiales bacterium]|nr:hypothetical protein [Chlamydiales bacterium]